MIYRKHGATARWENGTLVRVTECGVAFEEDGIFTCRPEGTTSLSVDPERVLANVREIETMDANVERLIVSEGIAEHEFDGRNWREQAERIHLSLVRDKTRALLDLGSFDLHDVRVVADAMTRLTAEREAPARLRFAPNVTAALLPSLIGVAPPNVVLDYRLDWFRPSYRVRPVKAPVDLRLRCDVTTIERDRPVAVAVLEPVQGLVLRVLIDDGKEAWPATVRVARIDAVAAEVTWYPYGAGSFGAEMML
jgi:hypothetical protein